MSPECGTASTGQPDSSARATVPCPACEITSDAPRHRPANRRATRRAVRWRAHRSGRASGLRFVAASTRTGSPASPTQRRPQQPVLGILRRRRRDQHERRILAGRRLDIVRTAAPRSAARRSCTCDGQARGILELGERPDEAQPVADAAVQPGHRRQPEPRPRLVELAPPLPQARLDRLLTATATAAGRAPSAACRAPSAYGGAARRRSTDARAGSASPTGTPSSSAAIAGASVRMSWTTTSGEHGAPSPPASPRWRRTTAS